MYSLEIVSLIDFEYEIRIRTRAHRSNIQTIVWRTKCPEIDLQETIEKVLRVSQNLRIIPKHNQIKRTSKIKGSQPNTINDFGDAVRTTQEPNT